VYEILRGQLEHADPRITYAELARALREIDDDFEHVTHRTREMYTALCEVGEVCRQLDLPPLPALVVRADSGRPGDAYYEGMPFAYPGERIAAWRRDLDAVRAATYPRRG
jgi:hypothetical protein